MPRITSCLLFAVALSLPLVPLAGQDRNQLCTEIQRHAMTVGQWASYRWTSGSLTGGTMRMAVVGRETHEGATFYWMEVMIADSKRGPEGRMIMQSLVSGLGPSAKGVRAVVMKQGDQPAMRMPEQMVQMMNSSKGADVSAEIVRQCQEMEIVGSEDVTVPAGHFHATHMRQPRSGMDVWLRTGSSFAMVKATMKDQGTLELTGQGTDAKSSITETPREMTGFPGAPPPH
ncbi:MAG: hypothetical protein AUH41_04670 [Gemmatimonadetes bacterium 13_1_40CM_66_11]|nr:MAG: hypothetical protein AUH41_04670 [Gemmatimonadetes bacterium 13_1_40CM_66_11]